MSYLSYRRRAKDSFIITVAVDSVVNLVQFPFVIVVLDAITLFILSVKS